MPDDKLRQKAQSHRMRHATLRQQNAADIEQIGAFLIPGDRSIEQHADAIGADAAFLFVAALSTSVDLADDLHRTYREQVRSATERAIDEAWVAASDAVSAVAA